MAKKKKNENIEAKALGVIIAICLVLFLIVGRASDEKEKREKEYCSKVCENVRYTVRNNKCICSNGTQYEINKKDVN